MCKRIVLAIVTLISGVLIYKLFSLFPDNEILIIIRNYIPDYLWIISFYFISVVIMRDLVNKYVWTNAIYVFIISIVYEVMQLLALVKGTFDLLDIFVYLLGIITACYFEKKYFGGDLNEKI